MTTDTGLDPAWFGVNFAVRNGTVYALPHGQKEKQWTPLRDCPQWGNSKSRQLMTTAEADLKNKPDGVYRFSVVNPNWHMPDSADPIHAIPYRSPFKGFGKP